MFLCEEFYAPSLIRNQVKSPVQWLVGSVRMLEREVVSLRNSGPVEDRARRWSAVEKLEQAIGGHDDRAERSPINAVRRALDGVGEAGDAREARVRSICVHDHGS